jgi:hypothetical protein
VLPAEDRRHSHRTAPYYGPLATARALRRAPVPRGSWCAEVRPFFDARKWRCGCRWIVPLCAGRGAFAAAGSRRVSGTSRVDPSASSVPHSQAIGRAPCTRFGATRGNYRHRGCSAFVNAESALFHTRPGALARRLRFDERPGHLRGRLRRLGDVHGNAAGHLQWLLRQQVRGRPVSERSLDVPAARRSVRRVRCGDGLGGRRCLGRLGGQRCLGRLGDVHRNGAPLLRQQFDPVLRQRPRRRRGLHGRRVDVRLGAGARLQRKKRD